METGSQYGKRILKLAVAILFSTAFLWRCANVGTPEGGPKDSLPPRVMGASPAFNQTNFGGKKIYITFDEYVQLKDQSKELFSSPLMKKKPILLVKGKSVEVEIQDTLKPNTTYALNFGSSIRDNNENLPLNGLRYVFSTGDKIDSMFMSGYTADAYKKDSVSKSLIYFYEATDSAFMREPYLRLADKMRPDSLPAYDSTLFKVQPAAVGRAENNGIFIAQNLKPVDYVVYAIEDTNGNFSYEPGVDKVGFLEGVYNPTKLPDFMVWFDTTRNYTVAEPQTYVRMFMDKQFKRQNLVQQKRPSQHKVELFFGAPYPQIDSIVLDGIDPSKIITEYVTKGRDTMNLWLNVPSEQLPDTIKGTITYMKHDSINQLVRSTDKLRLYWKYIESKAEQKEREKQEREKERVEKDGEIYTPPAKPNPFKYNLTGKGDVNPENDISISFDYPLVEMDSTRIELFRLGDNEDVYKVKYGLKQDSVDIRKWIISANWIPDMKYRLDIADSIFVDVAGYRNDSIQSDFTILSPDKFGTLTVKVKGKSDSSLYVLQLLSDQNKVLQEKKLVKSGQYSFQYIDPGDVKLRVVEDINGNGEWDSGDMIIHDQPERVEIYIPENGNELMAMKMKWDIEITVDMKKLFKPTDIMEIREQLRMQELKREERLIEEREKRTKENKKQNTQQNSNQPFNPTGSLQSGSGGFMGGGF